MPLVPPDNPVRRRRAIALTDALIAAGHSGNCVADASNRVTLDPPFTAAHQQIADRWGWTEATTPMTADELTAMVTSQAATIAALTDALAAKQPMIVPGAAVTPLPTSLAVSLLTQVVTAINQTNATVNTIIARMTAAGTISAPAPPSPPVSPPPLNNNVGGL